MKTLDKNEAGGQVIVLGSVTNTVQAFGGKTTFISPCFLFKRKFKTNRIINMHLVYTEIRH